MSEIRREDLDAVIAEVKLLCKRVARIERERIKRESHRQQLILGLLLLMSVTLASTKLSAASKDGKVQWTFELAGAAGVTATAGTGIYALFQLNKVRKDGNGSEYDDEEMAAKTSSETKE